MSANQKNDDSTPDPDNTTPTPEELAQHERDEKRFASLADKVGRINEAWNEQGKPVEEFGQVERLMTELCELANLELLEVDYQPTIRILFKDGGERTLMMVCRDAMLPEEDQGVAMAAFHDELA